jgi:hypothetical protein
MKIGVFLKSQDPQIEQPAHRVSKTMAEQFCGEWCNGKLTAKWLKDCPFIQLLTSEPFKNIKDRNRKGSMLVIPRILPPRAPEGLLLYYPHEDQRTPGLYGTSPA